MDASTPADVRAPTDEVEVRVEAPPRPAPRGVADVEILGEALDAAPHLLAPEQLSAAPGVFVDHEDGEGIGNDVNIRGFDFEHGSGVEMRVAGVPVNVPMHVLGQGYADVGFVIPEVVRKIRVLEGVYDVEQGDAAIGGSAYYDLGVDRRGARLSATFGSFDQRRFVAVLAPRGEPAEDFAAVAFRQTDGFGENRASTSASTMFQRAFDLAPGWRVRASAAAYGVGASLPGVVRQDDVDAGRIGYDDSYASPFAQGQGVLASRGQAGVELEGRTDDGGDVLFGAWTAVTRLRVRENFTGSVQASSTNPAVVGLGDLLESTNDEAAVGVNALWHPTPARPASWLLVGVTPGLATRSGFGTEGRSLLLPPPGLAAWDRRLDDGLTTHDLGGWVDLDVDVARVLRVTGGARADALFATVDDRLDGAHASSSGVALSPRATAALTLTRGLDVVASYGEGFRSLDATSVEAGSAPYSKIRSGEFGLRYTGPGDRYGATFVVFETRVENELVFDAEQGGLDTEGASTRRGAVVAAHGELVPWLFASASVALNRARYDEATDEGQYAVPSVPTMLGHAEVAGHGPFAHLGGRPVEGRLGAGMTVRAGVHLEDGSVLPVQFPVNARASARVGAVELGLDAYNLLGLRYPDDASFFVSNWSGPALPARHLSAAPPRTVLATLTLSL